MCLQLSHQNPVEINLTPPGTPGILTGIRAGMEAQTAWPGGNLQVLPWLMGSVALGLPSHTIQGGFLTTPHWLTPRALACCSGSCLNKPLHWTAFLPRGRRNLAWFMRKRATLSLTRCSGGLCHTQCESPITSTEQPATDTGTMVWKCDADKRLLQHLFVFSQEIHSRRVLFNLHNGLI